MPADRPALFKIAGDTAFFGEPIEAYLDDRNVFLDAFYAYYTDLEGEHCWIAEVDGEVAGFLTGCTDPERHRQGMRQKIMPQVWRKFLRRKYRLGAKSIAYFRRIFLAGLLRQFPQVDETRFPAHLHINVDERFRGCGLGQRLIEGYLRQLAELGVGGVHLMTTSMNRAACRLYQKIGFRLVDARQTGMWKGLVEEAVENRAYAREV